MEFDIFNNYEEPVVRKINTHVFIGYYKSIKETIKDIVVIKNCKNYEQEVILYTNTFTVLSKEVISLLNQRKKIKNKRKKVSAKKVLAHKKKV